MNLYEKINSVKSELIKEGIKKTGESKSTNAKFSYSYFELSGFMPTIIRKCEEVKLFTVVSFSTESAKLEIINAEKPDEKIEVLSPMSTAKLQGCHEVQNLGAVQTYLRRYLYMAAFDIVVDDEIDNGEKNPEPKKPQQPAAIDYTINPKTGRKFADYESGQLVELLKFFENSPKHSKYAEVVRGILVDRENQEKNQEVIEL